MVSEADRSETTPILKDPKDEIPVDIATLFTMPGSLVGSKNIHNIGINGIQYPVLLDTGSQVSIINETMWRTQFRCIPLIEVKDFLSVRGVGGRQIDYIGAVDLFVNFGEELCGSNVGLPVNFLVCKDSVCFTHQRDDPNFCIVGMNAIEQFWARGKKQGVPKRSWLDYAYSAFTAITCIEHCNDGQLGKFKCGEDFTLEPYEQVGVRCTFRSKVSGVHAVCHFKGTHKHARVV